MCALMSGALPSSCRFDEHRYLESKKLVDDHNRIWTLVNSECLFLVDTFTLWSMEEW